LLLFKKITKNKKKRKGGAQRELRGGVGGGGGVGGTFKQDILITIVSVFHFSKLMQKK